MLSGLIQRGHVMISQHNLRFVTKVLIAAISLVGISAGYLYVTNTSEDDDGDARELRDVDEYPFQGAVAYQHCYLLSDDMASSWRHIHRAYCALFEHEYEPSPALNPLFGLFFTAPRPVTEVEAC